MKFLAAFTLVFAVSVQLVFAQVDTSGFAIRVFGGEDTEAPTTPTLSSATPVATSQIDLVWTAAADNFSVSGYVVYQNGVAVGTTTQTSYSDIGLTASTTYTYYVQAFDLAYNYSSSSNSLDATTFEDPPPPTPGDDTDGTATAARVVLNELVITSGHSTSTFFIKTARPARFELRWGRTSSYELGYIVHDHYVDEYETTLTDLEPSTTYEYEIVGYTPYGKATVLKRGQFSTLGFSDIYPPANVNRFRGVAENNDVRLSWQVPIESFQYVRIVRNHLRFPTFPQDGAIVYQGKGESVLDKGILTEYSPVYYTAFVVDEAGNVSSGAVVKIFATDEGENGMVIPPSRPGTQAGTPSTPTPATVASTSPTLSPETRMPDLSEIFLIQEGKIQSFAHEAVILDSATSFVVSIPKDAVSESLKTIIATVNDPTNAKQSSSFLLRLNKEKTAYEAVVSPLLLDGMSRITVDIYDYSSAVVGTFEKTVQFKKVAPPRGATFLTELSFGEKVMIGAAAIIVLLVILFFLLYRRRTHA